MEKVKLPIVIRDLSQKLFVLKYRQLPGGRVVDEKIELVKYEYYSKSEETTLNDFYKNHIVIDYPLNISDKLENTRNLCTQIQEGISNIITVSNGKKGNEVLGVEVYQHLKDIQSEYEEERVFINVSSKSLKSDEDYIKRAIERFQRRLAINVENNNLFVGRQSDDQIKFLEKEPFLMQINIIESDFIFNYLKLYLDIDNVVDSCTGFCPNITFINIKEYYCFRGSPLLRFNNSFGTIINSVMHDSVFSNIFYYLTNCDVVKAKIRNYDEYEVLKLVMSDSELSRCKIIYENIFRYDENEDERNGNYTIIHNSDVKLKNGNINIVSDVEPYSEVCCYKDISFDLSGIYTSNNNYNIYSQSESSSGNKDTIISDTICLYGKIAGRNTKNELTSIAYDITIVEHTLWLYGDYRCWLVPYIRITSNEAIPLATLLEDVGVDDDIKKRNNSIIENYLKNINIKNQKKL